MITIAWYRERPRTVPVVAPIPSAIRCLVATSRARSWRDPFQRWHCLISYA